MSLSAGPVDRVGASHHLFALRVLSLFVFLVPLEDTVAVPGLGSVSRLAGIAALAVGVVALVYGGRIRRLRAFELVMLVFVAWVGLSSFWSVDPTSTASRLITYAQLFGMVFLISQLAPGAEHQSRLFSAYAFGAFAAALLTIGDFLHSGQLPGARYAADGFNANDLAGSLALAVIPAWHFVPSAASRLRRWIQRIYIPFGAVAVVLTASRGGAIAFVIAFGAVIIAMRHAGWGTRLVGGALLVGAIVVGVTELPASSWDRLATAREELTGGDLNYRREIWSVGFRSFGEHPLRGVGAGGYTTLTAAHMDEAFVAHNAFLSVAVELGIPGLLIFLAVFGLALLNALRLSGDDRVNAVIQFFTLVVVLLPLAWEYRKATWLTLSMLSVLVPRNRPDAVAAPEQRLLGAADGHGVGFAPARPSLPASPR